MHLDRASLHRHEPPRDRKTEARSTPSGTLGFRLLVLLEDDRQLLRRYPGPRVAHADDREAPLTTYLDDDLPPFRELDGVAHEIRKNLAKAPRVAARRHVGVSMDSEGHGPRAEKPRGLPHHLPSNAP